MLAERQACQCCLQLDVQALVSDTTGWWQIGLPMPGWPWACGMCVAHNVGGKYGYLLCRGPV